MRCSPSFQSATIARGSLVTPVWRPKRNVVSTTASDSAKALSTAPTSSFAFEAEIVAKRGMDHRRFGIERGFRIGDRRQCLVTDFDQFAGVLGLGARAGDHGADRFALPAGALDGDRRLRRRLEALQMRQHADPGRHDLGEFGAGDHGDDAGRLFRGVGRDLDDARVRVRRAHEGDMRHARQHDVADILPAPLRQPLQGSAAAPSGRCRNSAGRARSVRTGSHR